MECIKKEFVRTDENGRKWWRVILTATEAPESLDELTGADVDGMDDNIRFAAGSVLLTPDGNSVLYADGWSEGGGGISLTFTNESGVETACMYMTEPDPSKATTVVVAPAQTEKVDNIEAGIYVYISIGNSQELSYTGSVVEDTTSIPGITLYICNGDAVFKIEMK